MVPSLAMYKTEERGKREKRKRETEKKKKFKSYHWK